MTTEGFDWAKVVDYTRRESLELPKTQYELPGVTLELHKEVPSAVSRSSTLVMPVATTTGTWTGGSAVEMTRPCASDHVAESVAAGSAW